jgi:hypothetical protein
MRVGTKEQSEGSQDLLGGDRPGMQNRTRMRDDQALLLQRTLQELVVACPSLPKQCYWAGTSAIALEELRHRDSFDLDLHTVHALEDVRPLLTEIQQAFPSRFTLLETPNPYGSGFQGVILVEDGSQLTVQVMANFEDIPADQLVPSQLVPGIRRVGLAKYLRDKLTCLVERAESRDLVDVMAVVTHRESLKGLARRTLASLDEVLLVERLLSWSDDAIARDLKVYPELDPRTACQARDLLLEWLGP